MEINYEPWGTPRYHFSKGACNSSSSLKSSSESSSSSSLGRNDFAYMQQMQNENKILRFKNKWKIKASKPTNNEYKMKQNTTIVFGARRYNKKKLI